MKLNPFLVLIFFFAFFWSAFAQAKEARKILESSGDMGCEFLLSRADHIYHELQEDTETKAYIIFYEGKHSGKNPRRGDARNETEAIRLNLTKWLKLPKDRIILIDGGYDTDYRIEVWIIPKNAESPKPKPTLEEKDIKFRKGKPFPVVDCQKTYSDL